MTAPSRTVHATNRAATRALAATDPALSPEERVRQALRAA